MRSCKQVSDMIWAEDEEYEATREQDKGELVVVVH